MEPNRTLFSVMKSDEEKTKIILRNVLIMLSNRIYIDKAGMKHPLLSAEDAASKIKDHGDGTYTIKADDGVTYAIRIVFQRISATGKQSIINEFFNEYASYKKIIIARDYNNKIADYVIKHHTQMFKEASLLQNILDYRDQPKFELLTPNEMKKFKLEYNATNYTTKKMVRNDPIAKYFALRKGDIIRIIRPSPISGQAIDYRIVM